MKQVYAIVSTELEAKLLKGLDEKTGHLRSLVDASRALRVALKSFSDAPSSDLEDQRWHFEVLPAMRNLDKVIDALEQRP